MLYYDPISMEDVRWNFEKVSLVWHLSFRHSNILHLYLSRSCLIEKANPTDDTLLPWSPLWLRTTLELLLRRNTESSLNLKCQLWTPSKILDEIVAQSEGGQLLRSVPCHLIPLVHSWNLMSDAIYFIFEWYIDIMSPNQLNKMFIS